MDGARLTGDDPEGTGAVTASSWLVCEQTRAAIGELDRVLAGAITTRDPELREMALHLVREGGKRLRPALVLLVGRLGRAPEEELLQAAAAVELLHVASLYHDDVMDRAPVRRGRPSANGQWGNAKAAVAGTYLFSCAARLLATTGAVINRLGSESVADVCAGQLQELESAYDADLPTEEHLAVLERKTAALFVLPCRLGAALADVPAEHLAALERFGRSVGLAFQLADDALDIVGDAATVGKATGIDIAEGVYSLPVLYTLSANGTSGARLRALLRRARLSPSEVREALEIVRDGPAVPETLALARQLGREARDAVAVLPRGEVRESLDRLAEYAVSRTS